MLKPNGIILCTLLAAISVGGCGGADRAARKRVWSRAQALTILQTALRAELPDDRRRAVERISRSAYIGLPETMRTMDVVVRTDSSQLVRAASARCLAKSLDQGAFEPLTRVLEPSDGAQVAPAGPHLLATTLEALTTLRAAEVPCPDAPRLVSAVSGLLIGYLDDNQVRIDAARLLGYLPARESVEALIEALRPDDFAVAYEAQHALQQLTGEVLGVDQRAWREWLATTQDPLERTPNAHEAPVERGWWGRMFSSE